MKLKVKGEKNTLINVISTCILEEGDIDVILVTPPNDWLAHAINSEGVLCDKPRGVRRK